MSLEDLLLRARSGDREAQNAVFRDYYPAVLVLVKARMGRFLRSREESEDVAQSVFRQVLGSKAFSVLQINEPGAFENWLRRVVENKITDHLRAFGARKRGAASTVSLDAGPGDLSGQDAMSVAAGGSPPPEIAETKERTQRLLAALSLLPTALHREVMRLHYFESLSTAEVAARLAIDPRKVRHLRAEAVAVLSGLPGEDSGPLPI